MSNLSLIKSASCKLACGEIKGSGFFVTPDILLTCLHNIEADVAIVGESYGEDKRSFSFELVDSDTVTDLAILRTKDGYLHNSTLHVCSLEPIKGITWESFGYPATTNGRSIGEDLDGKIRDHALNPGLLKHDVVLAVEGYNFSTSVYQGFSGSPIVDDYGNVIAISRFSGNNSLDAVSVKRAKSFLEANNIICKQDYLLDFDEYACNCFAGFEEDPKRMCNAFASSVKGQVNPDTIARDLLGKLYYPHQAGTLEEIIAYLKKNPTTNKGLWKGWLELLSYLAMVSSARPDFNSITVTLTSDNFAKLFKVKSEIAKKTIDVKVNFFWTEGKAYLKVISDYAHDKFRSEAESNSCYIFNSSDPNFGRRVPSPGFKDKIIRDIGGDESAGFHIIKQMNFGMLSLNQLSEEVLNSDSVAQARPKIEELFINALCND
ncbi:serine protease [Pedobacter frigoris]|uniref:S1 family peptidase n=1 Tax=Pedobacter frigoris TaxID=2571272 RepID=UPI0029302A45|nr:serine protease [Pedobacter frigoris]